MEGQRDDARSDWWKIGALFTPQYHQLLPAHCHSPQHIVPPSWRPNCHHQHHLAANNVSISLSSPSSTPHCYHLQHVVTTFVNFYLPVVYHAWFFCATYVCCLPTLSLFRLLFFRFIVFTHLYFILVTEETDGAMKRCEGSVVGTQMWLEWSEGTFCVGLGTWKEWEMKN